MFVLVLLSYSPCVQCWRINYYKPSGSKQLISSPGISASTQLAVVVRDDSNADDVRRIRQEASSIGDTADHKVGRHILILIFHSSLNPILPHKLPTPIRKLHQMHYTHKSSHLTPLKSQPRPQVSSSQSPTQYRHTSSPSHPSSSPPTEPHS
jgi:hypothetical protein